MYNFDVSKLAVGDKVSICRPIALCGPRQYHFLTVTKITKTQILADDGSKWRYDGSKIDPNEMKWVTKIISKVINMNIFFTT